MCWPQYRAAARKYATLLVDGPFNSSTTSMLHFCACTARETRFCFGLFFFFALILYLLLAFALRLGRRQRR